MFRCVSACDTLLEYFSCLLRETSLPLSSLGSSLFFAPSLRAESRDGTINAGTNDNGIHRHDFSRLVFRLFLALSIFQLYHPSRLLSPSFSLCLCLPLSVIPRYLPHCLFHLDAPLHSLHYIPLLGTVTYPLATGACARGMHSRHGNAVERCNDRREFRARRTGKLWSSQWLMCLWTRESPPRYREACNEDKRERERETGKSSSLMESRKVELCIYLMYKTHRRDNVTL